MAQEEVTNTINTSSGTLDGFKGGISGDALEMWILVLKTLFAMSSIISFNVKVNKEHSVILLKASAGTMLRSECK